MRKINFIVLHCTAGPQTQTLASIQAHWRRLGWRNPGYHRLIAADGTVHELVPYSGTANGVAGHNSNSIHIAYIGGVDANGRPIDNRTPQQLAAMERLVREAHALFPKAVVQGHRDFSPDKNRNGTIEPHEWIKACPSFSVKEWLKSINFKSESPKQTIRSIARLNLRSGAGTTFPVITTLEANTPLQVLGETNNWTFVQHNSHTGWVSTQFTVPI